MKEFREAKKLIYNSKKIYIVGHVNPDGDSIGSAFAMGLALRSVGLDATVVLNKCSETFKFLPGIDTAVKEIKEDSYDLLITVDSSNINRFDISETDRLKAKKILVIDHHKKDKEFGDIRVIDDTCPAACEIVYKFLK